MAARLFFVGGGCVFACMAWAATDWPPRSTAAQIIGGGLFGLGIILIAASAILHKGTGGLPEARGRERQR